MKFINISTSHILKPVLNKAKITMVKSSHKNSNFISTKNIFITSTSNSNTLNTITKHQLYQKYLPIGLLASFTFLLSACNVVPKKESLNVIAQPNIPIDQTFITYDKATISTHKSPSVAVKRWQVFYSDTNLKSLINLALENNKDLENVLLSIKKSRAQYQITDNSSLPVFNAGSSMTRSGRNAIDSNSSTNYNVNLAMASYEVDLWGRVANQKEQALQSYLATTAGKDAVQIALIGNIAQVYVNLSYAQAQYDLAEQTVGSRKKSLFIAKKRFEAGVDSKIPTLQSTAALESAKLTLYDAETSIIKLRNALEHLIGVPLPHSLVPKAGVTKITNHKVLSAGLPSDLLHYRPDILQAEYNLKAAGANIAAARAAYFPSIRLNGNIGLSSSTTLTNLFKNSASSWSFGPSINIPIFDAGKLQANHEVAKINRQQALTSYEKNIQIAFKEVLDVLADRATIDKRLKSQYKLQQSYNEIFLIANARFKSGLSDYLAVLDAQRSLYATQQNILRLEQAKLISQIQFYQVLGGGVAIDVPVELSVPNHSKLVQFIKGNVNKSDITTKHNETVISTNIARGSSTSKVSIIQSSNTEIISNKALAEDEVNSGENAEETTKSFLKNSKNDSINDNTSSTNDIDDKKIDTKVSSVNPVSSSGSALLEKTTKQSKNESSVTPFTPKTSD